MTSWEALADALQLRPLERHRVAKAVDETAISPWGKLLERLKPLNFGHLKTIVHFLDKEIIINYGHIIYISFMILWDGVLWSWNSEFAASRDTAIVTSPTAFLFFAERITCASFSDCLFTQIVTSTSSTSCMPWDGMGWDGFHNHFQVKLLYHVNRNRRTWTYRLFFDATFHYNIVSTLPISQIQTKLCFEFGGMLVLPSCRLFADKES